MDWVLSVTTILVNCGLGWVKGKYWMWIIHAINAAGWVFYAITIKQQGLILLSVVTIGIDLVSAWKTYQLAKGR